MNKKLFLLLISLLIFTFSTIRADSSRIYKKGYSNPLSVLNSFLWSEKNKGNIGLTSKINIKNRNLGATIHPVSLNPNKIKIAFSKIKYIEENNDFVGIIFNEENLEVLSKNLSKGLSLANKDQDIIFQFFNKNKVTRGVVFAQKNSLNLIFFLLNDCDLNSINKSKTFKKKKKEFYKNHPNFSFAKKKDCDVKKKKISVTSKEGIYKKSTDDGYYWIVFTPSSWKTNSIK